MEIICLATLRKCVWNTIYFFGDLLEEKELNSDSLSGDTILNNLL